MRIIANSCRDMSRSRLALPAISLDSTPTDRFRRLRTLGYSPAIGAAVARKFSQLRRTIELALASLSEDSRLAITLVDVQGFSYEETAQVMNCSLGMVKSRISRARGELRDYLRRAGEFCLPSTVVIVSNMWIFGRRKHLKPELFSEYLDGRLDCSAHAKVSRQMDSYAACREGLGSFQSTVSLLRALPEFATPRNFTLPAPPVPRPIILRQPLPLRPWG